MTRVLLFFGMLLCVCAVFGLPLETADAQARGVALVIGNTNYPANGLSNAANDAKDVAAALNDLGFQVTLKEDVNLTDFTSAIDAFRTMVTASSGIALFYFSGHGMQVNGVNYLIPVDATIAKSTDMQSATVSVQRVFDALGGRSGANLVILDACRTNPFPASPDGWVAGLAPPTNPPPNSLISYSTSPYSVASDGSGTHSPYTRALLRFIRTPGLSLPDLFKEVTKDVEDNTDQIQVPWTNSSIASTVFLRNPIYVVARFTSPADDDAMILLNGDVVADWNQDGGAPKKLLLPRLVNEVVVKVYNQRSYTGGIPGLGGHLPEGWNYNLSLSREDGTVLIPLSGKEDVPADNGPHHGKLFTVATLRLVVDDRTGKVDATSIDPAVWTRQH